MKHKIKFIFNAIMSKHVLSLFSNGINAVVGMLTLGILFRYLTREQMGNWAFFLTVLLLVDTFRSGFLTTSFVKFYAGSTEARKNEIIGSSWYIALSITIILIAINIPFLFLTLFINDEGLTLFLRFFGINSLLSLPFFVSNCILQGKQRFDKLLILNFSNQGCYLLLLLISISLTDIDINIVLYCYLFANFFASSFSLALGWTEIKQFKFRTRASIKEIYHFGKYSVGTNLSATLLGTVDTFIIKVFLGPSSLAVYNAGTKLIQLVEIPLRSFIYTALPTLSEKFNQDRKQDLIATMEKYIGMLTVALIPIIILGFIFADYAILVLCGPQYVNTEAANILRIILLIAMLYPAERFFALTLDVIHLPKINFKKVLLMLTVTIVADYIGIKLAGNLYGVAIATTFTVLTGLLIGFYAINKNYGKFRFIPIFQIGYLELNKLVSKSAKSFRGK